MFYFLLSGVLLGYYYGETPKSVFFFNHWLPLEKNSSVRTCNIGHLKSSPKTQNFPNELRGLSSMDTPSVSKPPGFSEEDSWFAWTMGADLHNQNNNLIKTKDNTVRSGSIKENVVRYTRLKVLSVWPQVMAPPVATVVPNLLETSVLPVNICSLNYTPRCSVLEWLILALLPPSL